MLKTSQKVMAAEKNFGQIRILSVSRLRGWHPKGPGGLGWLAQGRFGRLYKRR